MVRRVLPFVCVLALAMVLPAAGQAEPIFGGFNSVLAFGEGESTSAQDLAAFEANGTVPAADIDQDQQYEGLEQAWPGFTASELPKYYKNSDFQAAPAPSPVSGLPGLPGSGLPGLGGLTGLLGSGASGSPPGVETPEQGVTVVRDQSTQVPRIYADTRAEAMWAAGYVTAEDRLFLMDVLRHTAEGTTADLLGPSAAAADSKELGIQDDSPQQLTDQMNSLPKTMGAEGAQALSDIDQYVAGINAFINLARTDPARLPAEYPGARDHPTAVDPGRFGRRRGLPDRPVHRVRRPAAPAGRGAGHGRAATRQAARRRPIPRPPSGGGSGRGGDDPAQLPLGCHGAGEFALGGAARPRFGRGA